MAVPFLEGDILLISLTKCFFSSVFLGLYELYCGTILQKLPYFLVKSNPFT